MSELNKALGNAGPGRLFIDAEGREWKFASITFGLMADFEDWLEATIKHTTQKTLSESSPEVQAVVLLMLSESINRGDYKFFEGPKWAKETPTPRGMMKLATLLLDKHHPKLTPEALKALIASDNAESKRLKITNPKGEPATQIGLLIAELLIEGELMARSTPR